jgi:RNA polymerase-binding transcription factor DksA
MVASVSDAIPDHAAPAAPVEVDAVDLDRVERDLEGVEAALARLDAGTYWTDEVTGAPLGDDLLATDPVARRALDRNPLPSDKA